MKIRVLFVCTENSSRSQMAEGFLRQQGGDSFEVLSGGADPTKLNPMAVEVMKEIGIDISGQYSKDVAQFLGQSFHYVIRVCDKVREKCPSSLGHSGILTGASKTPRGPRELRPSASRSSVGCGIK